MQACIGSNFVCLTTLYHGIVTLAARLSNLHTSDVSLPTLQSVNVMLWRFHPCHSDFVVLHSNRGGGWYVHGEDKLICPM